MRATTTTAMPRAIRSDIQALRTIAVALVVLFHLWPNRLPGGFIGVDVFFVISGFLITKHILHEVAEKRFKVSSFWARRIKRLLPASFIVLFFTGIAVVFLAPVSQWSQWLGEIQSSVFYFENWNLAGASVDYLALGNESSPVQHFWSLSTEEQFYFVWPLLVAGAISLAGRRNLNTGLKTRIIFVVLLVVTLASFTFGIYFTSVEPAIAYFSTPVRAWEFGAGALLAFVPDIRSRLLKSGLAVGGLVLIGLASFLIDTKMPFPGVVALLPVAATAAVIVANLQHGFTSKLLSLPAIQWTGDKSYSIYLWHWPILILAPYVIHTAPGLVSKIALIALTLILAWLTQRFVEQKFAKITPPKYKIFAIAATTSVLIASLAGLAIQLGNQQIEAALKFGKSGIAATQPCFGAAARAPGEANCQPSKGSTIYPALSVAPSDKPVLPDNCFSVSREQVAASYCALGVRSASIKVAAVGDSHIAHFAGALNALAIKNNWQLDLYAKGGCPFSFAVRVHDAVLTKNCPAWVNNVVAALPDKHYAAVITSQRSGVDWVGGDSAAVSGLARLWGQLATSGEQVIAIKDNPNPGQNAIDCLLKTVNCEFSRVTGLEFDPQVEAAKVSSNVNLINFDDIYCDSTKCFPIIGNVVVYRDDNHVTDTFARTLAPYIEKHIIDAITK